MPPSVVVPECFPDKRALQAFLRKTWRDTNEAGEQIVTVEVFDALDRALDASPMEEGAPTYEAFQSWEPRVHDTVDIMLLNLRAIPGWDKATSGADGAVKIKLFDEWVVFKITLSITRGSDSEPDLTVILLYLTETKYLTDPKHGEAYGEAYMIFGIDVDQGILMCFTASPTASERSGVGEA